MAWLGLGLGLRLGLGLGSGLGLAGGGGLFTHIQARKAGVSGMPFKVTGRQLASREAKYQPMPHATTHKHRSYVCATPAACGSLYPTMTCVCGPLIAGPGIWSAIVAYTLAGHRARMGGVHA